MKTTVPMPAPAAEARRPARTDRRLARDPDQRAALRAHRLAGEPQGARAAAIEQAAGSEGTRAEPRPAEPGQAESSAEPAAAGAGV